MRLSRLRAPAGNPLGGFFRLRWMASLMILAGVFTFAPSAPQWSAQAVVTFPGMHGPVENSSLYRKWGSETLDEIRASFWSPSDGLYIEETRSDRLTAPAFVWSRALNLTALSAAARLDHAFVPRLIADADSLHAYWVNAGGIGGFDVLPGPKPVDRYYDDNAWMTLGLLDVYEVTRDHQYLDWARETFRFVMSGEDDRQGGGIYWREQVRDGKNTCSTAPAALAALRLYQNTHEYEYYDIALRLYSWMNATLLDTDHLYSDHITPDGIVDRSKWSYNSALMIEVNTRLHAVTGQGMYLDEAEQIARAAEQRWINASTGAIVDDAPFAQHLADAFLSLYEEKGDTYWLHLVERALRFLHQQGTDPNGHYSRRWGEELDAPLAGFRLIDTASAARAYWLLARYE